MSDQGVGRVAVDGDHVSWLHNRGAQVWATALGEDPVRVSSLIETLANAEQIDGVTVESSVEAHLPARFRSPGHGHWSFWLLDPKEAGPRDSQAVELSLDDPRINGLLAYSDSAHIFAGDERVVRWSGVTRGPELLAVAAQIGSGSGAAHIVSVCTHPSARGQRLAGSACNRLIISALGENVPMIFLEMYAHNEPGRAVYSALGFTEYGQYRSGLIEGRQIQ